MHDPGTHLLQSQAQQRELSRRAADAGRATRLVRLRRLDRRSEWAATRARVLRLTFS